LNRAESATLALCVNCVLRVSGGLFDCGFCLSIDETPGNTDDNPVGNGVLRTFQEYVCAAVDE
jgi:hypothetical protein